MFTYEIDDFYYGEEEQNYAYQEPDSDDIDYSFE